MKLLCIQLPLSVSKFFFFFSFSYAQENPCNPKLYKYTFMYLLLMFLYDIYFLNPLGIYFSVCYQKGI